MSGKRTLAVMLAAVVGVSLAPAPAAASSPVPDQFIAKLYAEALGRMPDPAGRNGHVQVLTTLGCSHSVLAQTIRTFYNGPEFLGLGYDNASKVLALYRGVLNRDADQPGLNYHTNLLNTDAITWPGLVEAFIATRIRRACRRHLRPIVELLLRDHTRAGAAAAARWWL